MLRLEVLFVVGLMLAGGSHVSAQRPDEHDAMHGMFMPVSIPKGALYTQADVRFMQGMIAHHAQAIHMSKMAAAHGVNAHLLKFAQKIDQSQTAEIRLMQQWLGANKQFIPDTSSWRMMHMPGMLTADQLQQLDAATGKDFDRLFLELMIQHHNGALRMVSDLLATSGAAQDVDVSVFANDVVTVQTAEIGIMHQMLAELGPRRHPERSEGSADSSSLRDSERHENNDECS